MFKRRRIAAYELHRQGGPKFFFDNPNKGQALHNFLLDNLGINYLEDYWPELAKNPSFIAAYNDKYAIDHEIIRLAKSGEIDEKDALDYAIELPAYNIKELMIEAFPLKMSVVLYNSLNDKESLVTNIKNVAYEDIQKISGIVTLSNDRDMFELMCNNEILGNRLLIIQGYFRGAARNKNALDWLSLNIFNYPRLLVILCEISAFYPETIILSRAIFDRNREGKDLKTFAIEFVNIVITGFVLNEVKSTAYEILFQTGYFDYSFFRDELPMTKELQTWLDYTDV